MSATSVIIPARNAAGTISVTLSSLAADKALIGEILLIDDGSQDETATVALAAAARHSLPLRIVTGRFGGAGAARNIGLDEAGCEYVVFLDADDELFPGALKLLRDALLREPGAKMAVGAVLRRTAGRPDKTRVPCGYGPDLVDNAERYLRNELLPIAMGSAVIAAADVSDIRFPTAIGLDEDSCYWAAVLTRLPVVAIEEPVLLYHLDESRMIERFVSTPRAVLLGISRELNSLASFGISRDALQWRKAWVALRIARQLIMDRRYREAGRILCFTRTHPAFRAGWKVLQYRVRVAAGCAAQAVGGCPPVVRRGAARWQSLPGRTLVLTADPAHPAVSGADLRNWQNAKAIARFSEVLLVSVRAAGHEVSAEKSIRTAALMAGCEPRGPSLARRRSRVEMRIPRIALPRLLRLVREFRPEAIVVEGIPLFALIEHLRPLTRRLILDMHNIESDLVGKLKTPANRLADQAMRQRIERLERRAATMVDQVWVCSKTDRQRALSVMGTSVPIHVVPNGIPRFENVPGALPPRPDRQDGWPILLFAAHLGYSPNVAAVHRLAENILPLVRKTFPSTRLILAGRSPDASIRALATASGIELHPDPSDMSSFLSAAHLTAIPLRDGGGTRIKILEAMAWGVPVVATSVAAEGLDFEDGREISIADDDESLAAAVVTLCSDPRRMTQRRVFAREQVLTRFGFPAIAEAVGAALGSAGPSATAAASRQIEQHT